MMDSAADRSCPEDVLVLMINQRVKAIANLMLMYCLQISPSELSLHSWHWDKKSCLRIIITDDGHFRAPLQQCSVEWNTIIWVRIVVISPLFLLHKHGDSNNHLKIHSIYDSRVKISCDTGHSKFMQIKVEIQKSVQHDNISKLLQNT